MQVSKFKSRKEWADYIWRKLLDDIKDPNFKAALNSLLSSYEKRMIVNRLVALILIREGKTYRQIAEELWLSSSTIRSLKKTLENNSEKDYRSYRLFKTKREKEKSARESARAKKEIKEPTPILDWIDYYLSTFPQKHGPRWKFLR